MARNKNKKTVYRKNWAHQRKRKIDREEEVQWANSAKRKAADATDAVAKSIEAALPLSPSAVATDALEAGALLEQKGLLKDAMKRYTSAIKMLMPHLSETGVGEHVETLMAQAEDTKAGLSARKAKSKIQRKLNCASV
uniref:Uncharacterized protein n=1 Tax=Octactis speculum TaxID=3111310 RepID=A0A7S2DQG1_9STRA|mmetsp:Transcript_52385/g.71516  ORF Transcript_52385/g.71516 Transcript_52385/m.71516 type:complete len:138 (+) Transcript_52385:57-470(+)|eukprot:CAMPEP_0185747342 /NCGR_PEP_ID=MMETSP1174-20130828/5946_1 /TAXON_ID=35687 /ORGANISM="Dictyocha speculum, Strain CCMP1381" /LENGTH=137 /DNA_ID=CAMNT_0028422459 /DNA_START=55 /DNA_END=468 /DNA_ORIENTATION=-